MAEGLECVDELAGALLGGQPSVCPVRPEVVIGDVVMYDVWNVPALVDTGL